MGGNEAAAGEPVPQTGAFGPVFAPLRHEAADLAEGRPLREEHGRKVEEFAGAAVADRDTARRVDHDEALVHVLEGRLDERGLVAQLRLDLLAIGDVADHVDEFDQLAGLLIEQERRIDLEPDPGTVFVAGAIGDGAARLAGAVLEEAAEMGPHGVVVLGVDEVDRLAADELLGRVARHGRAGGRQVLDGAVEGDAGDESVVLSARSR